MHNEALNRGNKMKQSSVENNYKASDNGDKHNDNLTRRASVPSVVYQEDISVQTPPSKNRTESLTTKMRLLITSCDDETITDKNVNDTNGPNNKTVDLERSESIPRRKDSSEKDSLEESEESDWFNSDLSTPEYPSRRNSYNSKRSSLDIHGEMSGNIDPWPINMFPFGGAPTSSMSPFSPTFGGRKYSGGSSYSTSTAASRSSLLNVPHMEDNVFRNETDGHFIGGVEMRPISTSSIPNRRKSTSSLHVLQARYGIYSIYVCTEL